MAKSELPSVGEILESPSEPLEEGPEVLEIDRDGLDNIRIHDDDARDLIDCLTDASIGRAFVLFADPWPKARHNR